MVLSVSRLFLQQRLRRESKALKYSGRTENMAPIWRIKEMGLPATRKVTLGSAVVLVMAGALEPRPCQSSVARQSRSGTMNSGAASSTEEGSLVPWLEANRQTVNLPMPCLLAEQMGSGRWPCLLPMCASHGVAEPYPMSLLSEPETRTPGSLRLSRFLSFPTTPRGLSLEGSGKH